MNIINSLERKKTMKANTHVKTFKMKLLEAGISQKDLADEYKVSKQTVNGWVNDSFTPPLNTALWIAERLNCKVEDLWYYNPK